MRQAIVTEVPTTDPVALWPNSFAQSRLLFAILSDPQNSEPIGRYGHHGWDVIIGGKRFLRIIKAFRREADPKPGYRILVNGGAGTGKHAPGILFHWLQPFSIILNGAGARYTYEHDSRYIYRRGKFVRAVRLYGKKRPRVYLTTNANDPA